jgi:hypothetical protein
MNGTYIYTNEYFCYNCYKSLAGSRYIDDNGRPHCIQCWESLYSNSCDLCQNKISYDSKVPFYQSKSSFHHIDRFLLFFFGKDLSFKGKHGHERCFFCHLCQINLADKPFGHVNNNVYCCECFSAHFGSKCDACTRTIQPGTRMVQYRGDNYHESCFQCSHCHVSIASKKFVPKESGVAYCLPCYEDKFASKCVKCMRVISERGLIYRNQTYHRQCLSCAHCHTELAGKKFTSRDQSPYCVDCYGKLFAKKCTTCTRPITGS